MPHSNQTARRPPRFAENAAGATAIFLAAVLSAGCGSEPPPGLLDGSWPTGNCGTSPPPPGMQYTCTPDPGSKPVKCADEEAGLEFITLGDFTTSKASNFYIYIDNSGTGKITSFTTGWEPLTVADPYPRCSDGGSSNALHIQGGPFLGWGGGFGTSMYNWLLNPPPTYDCSLHPDNPLCVPSTNPYAYAMVDVSTFEGVALWARRGPDSQGGIRVMAADQNTDDDISYFMYQDDKTKPRNCERVRECACTNHKDCFEWASNPLDTTTYPQLAYWATPVIENGGSSSCSYGSPGNPAYYCEDPNSGVVPGYQTTTSPDTNCNTCNITNCDQPYPAFPNGPPRGGDPIDKQFFGKSCTPYTTRGGTASAYCYDPATDPPPAESDQTCGDHWTTPIYLTNQWTLYLVPFTTMQQQGFGKKFGKMDVHAVTMVRLTWDGGYIDYWIGKIAFYRHKS